MLERCARKGSEAARHGPSASKDGKRRRGPLQLPQQLVCSEDTAPSALPGAAAMFGRFSHQPYAPNCRHQRADPARLAAQSLPNALAIKARRWSAVMTPRDGGLRADDAVASHSAADGAGPSIKGARTYAHGTSSGAVAAVSCGWPAIVPKEEK